MKKKLAIAALFTLVCLTVAANGQTANVQPQNAQVVAGPLAQKLSTTSAQVWWETNTDATTTLKYGTNPNPTQTAAGASGNEKSHAIEIKGLQPGTTYYLSVVGPNGEVLKSSSFSTMTEAAAKQSFQISDGPFVEALSPTGVTIAWSTNRPASSIVRYGTDPNNLTQKAEAPWGAGTHRVKVQNLQPNTQYYFRVDSGQAQGSGQAAASPTFQVHTLEQGQQALQISPR
jgi:phosphodiesterase/alkaline phosphatase D-like protein